MSTLLGEARVRIRPDTLGFLSEAQRDISRNGTALGRTFSGAFKAGALALGGIAVAAGVAAKSTLDIGVTYQNSLNTLQAVSNATDATMQKVGVTAKRLGADITLPATSAADAAEAMTELAKGGLSVDQAMQAAKGTLQLAAAAQIKAGQAAEYQAQTLNAFHLSGDQASRVADVLANAANAASGEIGDFALGMAQASAVAASTGISLEDTAATLGVLANNGIKGSDAGTLLKSALLALQSPSKPAQKAMESLSLSAYDATGNFVGLSSIFGQLQQAQKKMTPEAYAYATSTLFGSDAARLAGIAGHEGAAGFDAMAKAMGRQGAAADVAAAKAKGVGGAIEAFKSQVETFQIDLFERGAPNIEKLIRYAAQHFPAFGDAVIGGIDRSITTIQHLKDVGVDAFQTVARYVKPVTDEVASFVKEFDDADGVGHSLFSLLKTGGAILVGVAKALHPVVDLGGGLLHLFNDLPGPIKTVLLLFGALKLASKIDLFGKLGGRSTVPGSIAAVGSNFVGFGQTVRANMSLAGDEVGRFSKTMGGFSAGFQTYMPQATKAVGNFTGSISSAYTQARELRRYNVAEMFGTGSLAKSTGEIAGLGAAAKSAAKGGVSALRSGASGLVSTLGGTFGVAMAAGGILIAQIGNQMQEAASQTDKWSQALLAGGTAARQAMAEAKKADDKEPFQWMADLDHWSGMRASIDDAKKSANDYFKTLSPVEQGQSKVAEWTNTLADRLNRLGPAAEDTRKAQERLAYWTRITQTRQEDLADATKGATGRLQEQTQAALAGTNADLAASMATTSLTEGIDTYKKSMADATLTATQHQQAADEMSQTALATANALAQQAYAHSTAATDEGKHAEADRALYDSLVATAAQLGENTPEAIKKLIASLAATSSESAQTAGKLRDLGISVTDIPGDKFIEINAPTEEQTRALNNLGFVVTTLPDKTVVVSANTGPAEDDIKALVQKHWETTVSVITARTARENKDFQDSFNGHAAGGAIFGPGTSTSDSIPAWLSNGEYVIKAKSVGKYGLGLLDSINTGRFAEGGPIGRRTAVSPKADVQTPSTHPTSGGDLHLHVTVDGSKSSAPDQIEAAMFKLRVARRGGVYAGR